MTREPWRSDHRLSADAAAALIEEQFPELAPVAATELGEGWDGVVFAVNGAWAFRFPKRADVVPFHKREAELLDALAPRLPLAVPRVRFVGRPSPAFPLRFSGYALLPGIGADAAPEPSRPSDVARDFGPFLAVLHAFPVDEVRRLGFAERRPDARWTRQRGAARDAHAAAVTMLGPDVANSCAAIVDDDAIVPVPYAGPPRVLHGDLGAEHLLVAEDGARVTGVIDWADAHLGDPAGDLTGLWLWGGAALVEETARAAGHFDAGAVARARYGGFLEAMNNLRYGVEAGRPVYVRSARRALLRGLREW